MGDKDFRVEQTYGEIEEAIFDTAYTALVEGSDPLPPTKGEQEWAEKEARRIASHTVMRFDAADLTAAQQEIERLREREKELAKRCYDKDVARREAQARAETAEAERDKAIKERDDARALSCVQCAKDVDEARAERDKLREALLQTKGEIENLLNSAPAFREGSIGAAQLTRLKVALGSTRQALGGFHGH